LATVNSIKIEFSSLPVNVSFARVAVGSFAAQLDFTLNDIEEIKVAVSEAVTNAIVHGYEKDANKIIALSAEIKESTLLFIIEDYGKGIEDMEQALQPAYSTDPERMGLGFSFMQSFSDSFKVDSTPGSGTKITMTRVCKKEVTPIQGH